MQTGPTLPTRITKKVNCNFQDCDKKISELKIAVSTCACKQIFCPEHRPEKKHICPVDHKQKERERLTSELMGQSPSIRKSGNGQFHRPDSNNAF